MRRSPHRHRRRPKSQSQRINYGPQTEHRAATRVPNRLARQWYRPRSPFARRRYAWSVQKPGPGIANAEMGPEIAAQEFSRTPAYRRSGQRGTLRNRRRPSNLPHCRGCIREFRIIQLPIVIDYAASRPERLRPPRRDRRPGRVSPRRRRSPAIGRHVFAQGAKLRRSAHAVCAKSPIRRARSRIWAIMDPQTQPRMATSSASASAEWMSRPRPPGFQGDDTPEGHRNQGLVPPTRKRGPAIAAPEFARPSASRRRNQRATTPNLRRQSEIPHYRQKSRGVIRPHKRNRIWIREFRISQRAMAIGSAESWPERRGPRR